MLKKILLGLGALIVLVLLGGGGFVMSKTSAYDSSMAKVYDIPVDKNFKVENLSEVAALFAKGEDPTKAAEPVKVADATPPPKDGDVEKVAGPNAEGDVAADTKADANDPAAAEAAKELARLGAVYKRGEHLTKSIGGCLSCHGEDLATPEDLDMGPLGVFEAPNISMGGKLKEYSDGELHRLFVHGIKKDGTSLIFMPAGDFAWWPDSDIAALIGYLRTFPASDKSHGTMEVKTMGKVLDRMDNLPIDIARRMDHDKRRTAPTPAPTAAYGAFLAKLCMGCHGPTLSGGPIPGAPPSMPVPLNITAHETGIAHYDFKKFETLMRTAKKPDGSDLDPFMPVKDMKNMNEVEMKALWEFLQSTDKKAFGGR